MVVAVSIESVLRDERALVTLLLHRDEPQLLHCCYPQTARLVLVTVSTRPLGASWFLTGGR